MHSETVPTTHNFHDGVLFGMHPFIRSGLRLNGQDMSEPTSWEPFIDQNKPAGTPVELSAHTGDPQMDKDLVYLGKHTLLANGEIWPGKTPPPTHYNMAANALRAVAGDPQEGHQIIPDHAVQPDAFPHLRQAISSEEDEEPDEEKEEKRHDERYEDEEVDHRWYPEWKGPDKDSETEPAGDPSDPRQKGASFSGETADVRSEMDLRTSKWSVVALGEMQQPSAVGGAGDPYNPVVDGPNPNGLDIADNATNSPEQEVALQTWVNMAVDLLNRGEQQEAVLAQLAHDGCPDPQAVIQRAQQQPMDEKPVSDEIGQDPFDVPPAQDQTGSMESVSQQPPALGKVRIKGSKLIGTEIERYEDLWGQGTVRIALDEGGTINVAPDAVEEIGAEPSAGPVQDIQSFIDSFPPVEPHRASVEARISNLKIAKLEAVRAMQNASFSERVELDRIALAADHEQAELRQVLRSESLLGTEVLTATYEVNKFLPELSITDRIYQGNIREAAAIWAHESPYNSNYIEDGVSSAARFAATNNMTGEQMNEFISAVREKLEEKIKTEATMKVAATTDNDGPAEQLFA